MKRALVLVVLVAAVTGCGGSADLAKSSAPCLRKLGVYVDRAVPKELNILGFAMAGVTPPPGVTDVADISFHSPGPGAIRAQLYYNHDAKAAVAFEQTWGSGRTAVPLNSVIVLWKNAPSPKDGTVMRVGRTVVFWTTTPSRTQRREVANCVGA